MRKSDERPRLGLDIAPNLQYNTRTKKIELIAEFIAPAGVKLVLLARCEIPNHTPSSFAYVHATRRALQVPTSDRMYGPFSTH